MKIYHATCQNCDFTVEYTPKRMQARQQAREHFLQTKHEVILQEYECNSEEIITAERR